ncbi:MAG: XTP/dITP diphosphatase [Proteobacteria bacterium]|nr:XTP/dITP diphosphatase [Pseudomonadota bacterium]
MVDIVIATRNPGKVRELQSLLDSVDVHLLSLDDFDQIGEVEETGNTFEENALLKATEVAKATGYVTIADDSGLMVDVLDGRPGVLSARYAGDNASDSDNNKKLLNELKDLPLEKRDAAFVCVIASADPKGKHILTRGVCRGKIALEEKGQGGFGYDPLFFPAQYDCTMAEISPEIKNSISHRALAVEELKKLLPSFLAQL